MLHVVLPSLLTIVLPVWPGLGSTERISLHDHGTIEGLVLAADQDGCVVFVTSPDESAGLRFFGTSEIDGEPPAPPTDADWVTHWKASVGASSDFAPDASMSALITAIEKADTGMYRQALSGLRRLVGRRNTPLDLRAVDRLIQIRTEQPLADYLADLQLNASAVAMTRSAFRLWYRPTIEADVLAARLDQIEARVIDCIVPVTHDPEDLARFLLMSDDDADVVDPPAAGVDLHPPRAHAISAWLDAPEQYDGSPEAAVRMQQRVAFALQLLRARLDIARQQRNDEDEQRVLAERARLAALREAVQNRVAGGLTPAEKAERQRAADEAAQRAYEEEMTGQGARSDDDDEDCDGRGRQLPRTNPDRRVRRPR